MKVKRDSWHCKVYRWWYQQKHGHPLWGEATYLCPYMRAILFWAPIRALFTPAIMVGWMPLNVILLPNIVLLIPFMLSPGPAHRLWVLYGLFGALVLGAAILAGIIALGVLLDRYVHFTTYVHTKVKVKYAKASTWTFPELVFGYIKSFHTKVCPELNWRAN